jgi:succinate-semialdehyde dehydrogenase
MTEEKLLEQLISQGQEAQKNMEKYSQAQVDSFVKGIGKVIFDHAEMLAMEAIEETGMGVYEDKLAKIKGKSKMIWLSLKNKKSVGIIKEEKAKGLIYVAKPKGIIAAITPTTNPVVTPMCNAMFALKGRNAIIVAPHPRSKKCSAHTVALMNEALEKLGAPQHLIQVIAEPTMELTQSLMSAADVVVATGGMGLVKAAYASGKPAYGVGAGNVQVIMDREYDYDQATKDIIAGRKFDNGIICSGEQCVITPVEDHTKIMESFTKNGAHYICEANDVDRFRKVMFPDGKINTKLVGQSVQHIAKVAKVSVPETAKIVILQARGKGDADLLCKEKMFPYLITLSYKTFEEAVDIAKTNLYYEGAGHTAAIHSQNREHIKQAGQLLPISRLVVNQPSSTGAGGSIYNGFNPTTTLGCGSWGNNSISENLNYKHFINVSQIGFYNRGVTMPTEAAIWNQ